MCKVSEIIAQNLLISIIFKIMIYYRDMSIGDEIKSMFWYCLRAAFFFLRRNGA